MTQVTPKPEAARAYHAHRPAPGSRFTHLLRSTDPKDIAILYLTTAFAFFLVGGAMALLIRGELAVPGLQFLSTEQYNQLFTMHGTIMLLLYATPILFGFANYIVPLQIGAPDVAFPRLDETLGKVHFWTMFIGFHLTFLVQHWLGNAGFPRRYADYLPTDDFTVLNSISSIGAFLLGASTLPFLWNVFRSYRYGRVVTVDDPWGFGNSLEWATSCPPPRHNFTELPRIRSERPAFELHYPHLVQRFHDEAHAGGRSSAFEHAAQRQGAEVQPDDDPKSR